MWDWWGGGRGAATTDRTAQALRENRQLRRVNATLLAQLRDAGREIERLEGVVKAQGNRINWMRHHTSRGGSARGHQDGATPHAAAVTAAPPRTEPPSAAPAARQLVVEVHHGHDTEDDSPSTYRIVVPQSSDVADTDGSASARGTAFDPCTGIDGPPPPTAIVDGEDEANAANAADDSVQSSTDATAPASPPHWAISHATLTGVDCTDRLRKLADAAVYGSAPAVLADDAYLQGVLAAAQARPMPLPPGRQPPHTAAVPTGDGAQPPQHPDPTDTNDDSALLHIALASGDDVRVALRGCASVVFTARDTAVPADPDEPAAAAASGMSAALPVLPSAALKYPPVQGTHRPPLPATDRKYCIVLDVDETQVHFSLENFPTHKAELRFRGGIQTALQRLCALKAQLELGLWTAGVPRYAVAARELLSMVAQERQVFDWTIARDGFLQGQGTKKDLSRLQRDLDYTMLIDNSRKVAVQERNTLIVSNFYSMNNGATDHTLAMVADLVEELVLTGATVPAFLEEKARAGLVYQQGGHYHLPSVWPDRLRLHHKRRMYALRERAGSGGNAGPGATAHVHRVPTQPLHA